jgi:hypothetical protein
VKSLYLVLLSVFVLSVAFLATAYGQQMPVFPGDTPNQIEGGLGLNWINNQPYYNVTLYPDLTFGKWGVGLDLTLDVDAHGNIRSQEYKDVNAYLAIIRYISYGQPLDPLFVKVGALDYVTIGEGNIMNEYNNSPSFDARRIGAQFNMDNDTWGFQTLWGNFGDPGLGVVRGFIRPLKLSPISSFPIINSLEVGATYATDFSKYADVSAASLSGDSLTVTSQSLSIAGADVDLPLIRTSVFGFDVYGDYAKIINYGSGEAAGGKFTFNFPLLLNATAQLERRFNGDHYIAGYFDSFYELERFEAGSNGYLNKARELDSITAKQNGVFGQLLIRVINTFDILGSFSRLDGIGNTGIFHAWTSVAPQGSPIVADGGYDKIEISDFQDLLTTDDRSYLYAELGYKPMPWMIVSMVYSWTWTPDRDANNNIIGYAPQKRIEPKVSFVYNLPN